MPKSGVAKGARAATISPNVPSRREEEEEETRSCKLELSLRLRGGGGGADSERMCCESSAYPGFELPAHIVAVLAIYRCSTMAQTGVSGPVVVDGESFLDALFASAGQG